MTDAKNNLIQKIWMLGWEVYLGRHDEAKRIIRHSRIDKAKAMFYSSEGFPCSVFQYVNGELQNKLAVKTYDYELLSDSFDADSLAFEYFESEDLELFGLMFSRNSKLHRLGGGPQDGFVIPCSEKVDAPFQYIAQISNSDPNFSWLPFDNLQICHPIHANVRKVFFDYSEPLKPRVIDTKELEDISYPIKEIDADSVLEFKEKHFQTKPLIQTRKAIGYGGIPTWLQWPAFPVCPHSGEDMRFVCQFDSRRTEGIKLAKASIEIAKDDFYMSTHVGQMNFWGDGVLYVFFHPDSKVLCTMIQNQ